MKTRNFKKLLFAIVLTLVLCLACAICAGAETQNGNFGKDYPDLSWSLDTETGVLTVSGTGRMPDYTDSLALPWSSLRSQIKSVIIEDGITSVGEKAFYSHTYLTEVSFPESLTEIGNLAFYECKISEIYIPKRVNKIAVRAFSMCPVTNLVIDEENQTYHSTNNCIIETNSNTLISGFYTSIIPQDGSVTSISNEAFRMNYQLRSIHIPASVTDIGEYVFARCYNLTEITVDEQNPNYCVQDGCLIDRRSNKIIAGTRIATIPQDKNITAIADGAFYAVFNSNALIIPNTVISIGNEAFYQCRFREIEIPESVKYIGDSAFANSALTTVVIHSLDAEIYDSETTFPINATIAGYVPSTAEEYALKYSREFDEILFDGGYCGATGSETAVTWKYNASTQTLIISGTGATADFSSSSNAMVSAAPWDKYRNEIKAVVVEEGITYLGASAFASYRQLNTISLPSTVTELGRYTLFYTTLKTLHIPKNLIKINLGTFSRCGSLLESITVEEGNPVFHSTENCLIETATKTLVVGCNTSIIPGDGSVTSIGMSAFANNLQLTNLVIPSPITRIGDHVFSGSINIESIVFNGKLSYVGTSAFSSLKSTATVKFSQSGAGSWNSYWNASTSAQFVWTEEPPATYSSDGINYTKRGNGYVVSGYSGESLLVEVPSSYQGLPVTAIGIEAFRDLNIKEVIIPESVKRIERQAFYNCVYLDSITINGYIDYIGFQAFYTQKNSNTAQSTKVIFTKQCNTLPTWHASWRYGVYNTITMGSDTSPYISPDCHLCNGYIVANATAVLSDDFTDVSVITCSTCGFTRYYSFNTDSALLGFDFETPIEDNIPTNMELMFKPYESEDSDEIIENKGKYIDRNGGKAYQVESTVWIDDSTDHVLFSPDKLFVSLDLMFDLDAFATTEGEHFESILTFLPGLKFGDQLGSKASFEYPLRYYRGTDGVHKLTYMNNPGEGHYVVIEDEKWYHCNIIIDRTNYYIYVDNEYIGYIKRNDYTEEKFGGYTTFRLGDDRGTYPYFDNLYIYSFDNVLSTSDCEDLGYSHVYSNNCDTTCDKCGAERVTSHSYKATTTYNSYYHWYECEYCSARKNQTTHKYTNSCDETCNDCAYVRTASHTFGNEYVIVELGHQKKCLNCGAVSELGQHLYATKCDAQCYMCLFEREVEHEYQCIYDEDGLMHRKICINCGDTTEPSDHTFGDTEYNSNFHWKACSECNYKFISEHIFLPCAEKCLNCEFTRIAGHTWSKNLSADSNRHWYECTSCGTKKDVDVHTWDDGVVTTPATETQNGFMLFTCTVCEYESTIILPPTSSPENTYNVILSSKREEKGSTFIVNLIFDNIPAVKSILISSINYDRSILELKDVTWKIEGELTDWEKESQSGILAFLENTPLNGVVMTLTFKANDDYIGDTTVGVDIKLKKETYYVEGEEEFVNVTTYPATITFVEQLEYVRGDIDGNGVVNSSDAIYLLRHNLLPNKYPVKNPSNHFRTDVNCDGKVNTDDAIYLLRHTFSPEMYPIN